MIIIDVSNLTMHLKKFIRTGIQEVIYQTLLQMAKIKQERPELDLVLLPQMPRTALLPYPDVPRYILESIEKDLGLSSKEVWGFDLAAKNYHLSDNEIFELLSKADRIHIQSLLNLGPIAEEIKRRRGKKPIFSQTLYDLVPELYPEYCDDFIAKWYQTNYLPSILEYVDQVFSISRHTALDFANFSEVARKKKIQVLPLPFELLKTSSKSAALFKKIGVTPKNYLVYLGSLEPRKNFEGLLEGFENYITAHPTSNLKLVVVGSTGWKKGVIEKRLRNSPASSHLVRTGYLEDPDLAELIENASAIAMLSHYEGYGLPIAQAFSKGVPAITTLGSSLPEACGGDAYFVDPMDPHSVGAGIRMAIEGPTLQKPEHLSEWNWSNYARTLLKEILA